MAKTINDLKPEEKDEILSFLGMDDFDNFKDTFSKKFFTYDTAIRDEGIRKEATAKRMKEISGKLHKVAKFLKPELTLDEFNSKPLEDNIPELENILTTKLTEYETRMKSGNDKRLNDLEHQLQEKDKSIVAYKELAEKEAAEREKVTNEYQTGMRTFKINHQYEQLKGKLPWIDEPTDVQRIGFDTKVAQSYKFELDEKDQLQIFTSDGKPIPSKTKAGQMADPLEVLEHELDVNKLKKNNNAKPNNITKFVTTTTEGTGRQIPADALRRMNEVKR